jgi:hypothetical protein
MNWKEFFKLTKLKLIIFALFLVIGAIGLVIFLFSTNLTEIGNLCGAISYDFAGYFLFYLITVFLALPIYGIILLGPFLSFIPFLVIGSIIVILFLIYSYVLACFISWLFYNYKERKAKVLFAAFVAGLVILSAIFTVQNIPPKPSSLCYTKSLQYRNFKAECESLCQNAQTSGNIADLGKYCFTKLTGYSDLNGNGKIDAVQSETKLLSICEDGMYCFQVTPCQINTTSIDWEDCRQIVCNAYNAVYNDTAKAGAKVKLIFPNAGSCNLDPTQNWYNIYGFNASNPCAK